MSRYDVVHTSEFRYAERVRASYNEARMTPAGRGQKLLDFDLEVSPVSSRYDYTDYWGTHVSSFEVLRVHSALKIVATSRVEITAPDGEAQDRSATWEQLTDAALRDRMSAYLTHTPTTDVPAEVKAAALDLSQGVGPDEAALRICAFVRDAIEYVPGVTTVHTPAADAWEERKGVCQDFAHLSVGALRSIGIPALYVSGYYDPRPAAELDAQTVSGQSHAWIEWWAGSWHPYDPTNGLGVGDQHVVVGRGREYNDVPPFKGVIAGGGTSELLVRVDMTRTG